METYADSMFFILGISRKVRDGGTGQTRQCPRCHNTTSWRRQRSFSQLTLFFVIPLWRWSRQRVERCGICGESIAV